MRIPCVNDTNRLSTGPVGLILTGGGARAAYQAGVLAGVMDILDPNRAPDFTNPFSIISGSSAGAINATALGCFSDDPHTGTHKLLDLWGNLHTGMVYRADAAGLFHTGLQWLSTLAFGWLMPHASRQQPRSLLDNRPLGRLLSESLDFERLRKNLASKRLDALAITAAAYTTGEHITFYQANRAIKPWQRALRQAVPCTIGVDHLLASSSIPFIFPAQPILVGGQTAWCGDGSMRQLAPMSPAIHLGAKKIFVIGTGYKDDTHPEKRKIDTKYPTLAQIGGHALSNIFLDSISMDVERMDRINSLLAQLPPNVLKTQSLRPVSTFSITPSRSLDEMALVHLKNVPRAARALFRVIGVSSNSGQATGGALISYLLFEASYTQELIRLGRSDSLSRIEEVKAFFKETPE
ncbi:patatin-like phospholipase family protein [Candidimonas sp. SYP-B2681]|uniref:patatin-like phospholipase family protein n=1 Tax=Candidimonas sp. SYP-B2681 TaxID=2497686 RepID=UPI000F89781B|nr:patatin-like phospholipase family protein [Candidimonas sp. SYP-B2681]RTZ40726.1 patatin-like phospholipase family protein [Candidimonas sp. SYP-B2681]